MMEKDKSKRPFIIDIFKFYPTHYFSIQDKTDKENFDAYCQYKHAMDRKRIVDGNKHKIHQ